MAVDANRHEVVSWLLEGDPAIRWQVMRDLLEADPAEWRQEQQRVAREGWGAELLSHRDESGRWTPRLYGRKWISTTYSLVLLRRLGLPRDDPWAIESCLLFFDEAMGDDGGIDVSSRRTESEMCVTAMAVALFYWFEVEDARREIVLEALLNRQLPDGGWNCIRPSKHGSFHTTASAMEAMRECALSLAPDVPGEVAAAEEAGREFLLAHRLYRSHRTGEVVNEQFLRFSFPPRWHYDVLRGLELFWSAGRLEDSRLEEAIEVVRRKQRSDGTWPLQQRWPGETWFEMETVGEPSRWNTLRAMRVLDGWDAGK
ncbi:MAG TPA: hypothetical protein VLA91_06220 [Acidimicrobiia bacterium]|nr:hypothetical protein [Acidimicrobiia bacterium]